MKLIVFKIGDWVVKASNYEDYGYLQNKIWEVTYASVPHEKTGRQFVDLKHDHIELNNIPTEMLQKLWISPF